MNRSLSIPTRALLTSLIVASSLLTGCEGDTFVSTLPVEPDGDPPVPGIDTDGDGLTDREEFEGWTVAVDLDGYGEASITHIAVRSDPELADTDGDGLDDMEELRLRLDPRSADTDRDGLSDADEVMIWATKPASVDTDGDARGPDGDETPNPLLFDGNELRLLCDGSDAGPGCRHPGTSPTLADTDGDARSDYEEFDDPFLHPLIAELPRLELEVDSDVALFLRVDYEESLGEEEQYGTTFSTSQENQRSSSFNLGFGVEGGFDMGWKLVGSANFGWEWSHTSTETASRENSRYKTESSTMTETSASGTIGLSFSARNAGLSTFTLADLGVSVLSLRPGDGLPQVLATLRPELDSITLAPGDRVPFIEVSSTDVAPNVVKRFLSLPSSLYFTPAVVNLHDENGIDFDFLTQTTYRRTALVAIDSGEGSVDFFRIATNVRRGSDGELAGVTMGQVMEVLGFSEGDAEEGYTLRENADGIPLLFSLGGKAEIDNPEDPARPRAVWRVGSSVPEQEGRTLAFASLVLRAGDEYVLAYGTDEDGDGLLENEEDYFGTENDAVDSDGDGLEDAFEVKEGWMAGEDAQGRPVLVGNGYPRRVHSNPRSVDTDLDGLPDGEELCLGTDPTNPDTDGDGLRDGPQPGFSRDPYPLIPARRLYVDAASQGTVLDGSSWFEAFHSLAEAMEVARLRNADIGGFATCENPSGTGEGVDPSDDVSEIWVARGTYEHPRGIFELVDGVAIYGGFVGNETSREQRVAVPPNGTSLLGDNRLEDYLVKAIGESFTATLDGFSIEGGGGMLVDAPSVTLRNLRFSGHLSPTGRGGALSIVSGAHVVEDCAFDTNRADETGGAVWLSAGEATFRRCSFEGNQSASGGALHHAGTLLNLENCRFSGNEAQTRGGALFLEGDTWLTSCDLEQNAILCAGAPRSSGEILWEWNGFTDPFCNDPAGGRALARSFLMSNVPVPANELGGAIYFAPGALDRLLSAVNCRFWRNRAPRGGAVYIEDGTWSLVNCTLAENEACEYVRRLVQFDGCNGDDGATIWDREEDSVSATGGVSFGGSGQMVNCIAYGNGRRVSTYHLRYDLEGSNGWQLTCDANELVADERGQAYRRAPGVHQVAESCIQELGGLSSLGQGNIDTDPAFVGLSQGLLALKSGSPCIDQGFNSVDTDPLEPGVQSLPALDLSGQPRIVDFRLDGQAFVDMGAYEAQP